MRPFESLKCHMKNGIAGIVWHLRFNRIVFQFSYRTDTDVTFDNLNRRYFLSVTQYDQFIYLILFRTNQFWLWNSHFQVVLSSQLPKVFTNHHNQNWNIWYLFFCQFSSVLLVVGGFYLSANIKLREIAPSKNNIHLF